MSETFTVPPVMRTIEAQAIAQAKMRPAPRCYDPIIYRTPFGLLRVTYGNSIRAVVNADRAGSALEPVFSAEWLGEEFAELHIANPAPARETLRRDFVWEHPDGKRERVFVGQRLYHRKTGGHYVLSSFGYREATMEFGFNYVSEARAEQYWRPIAELFDGRWIFWDGASELPPPPCDHKRQKWNITMTSGHCQDCGEPLRWDNGGTDKKGSCNNDTTNTGD